MKIRPPQLAVYCSYFAFALSILACAGWYFDVTWLRSGVSNTPQMTPLTAVLILLLSTSLRFAAAAVNSAPHAAYQWASQIAAGLTVLLSVWLCLLYLIGLHSDFELLLFRERLLQVGGVFPGRPSPHTAITALLLGAALALAARGNYLIWKIAMAILGAAFILPWIALFGYASASNPFFTLSEAPQTGMSFLTAIAFTSLILGKLGLRPERGLLSLLSTQSAGSLVIRWLAPLALLLPLPICWLLTQADLFDPSNSIYRLTLSWGIASLLITAIIIRYGFTLQRFEDRLKHQAALQRYAQELKRSNEELDRFVYAASHDLKAPLRGIKNLAEWIREDNFERLSQSGQEDLLLIHERAVRMEALLNGLLQYSRIGRGDETLERVDTGALVREIVALYADTHTLTIEIDPDLPRMYLAKTPFSIVVRNLIGNAIKHHSRPDGHIWVHASDRDDQVAFTIRDDGPGILPQYHEEIFKMFSTLHTPNETSGSGLGLAMVKKALEFVGGDIKLDSNEGQGVSITFTWPKSTQVQT